MNIEKMENHDLEENKTILDEEAAMKEEKLAEEKLSILLYIMFTYSGVNLLYSMFTNSCATFTF